MNVSEERDVKKVLEDEDEENITLRWKERKCGKKIYIILLKIQKKKLFN